MTPKIKNVIHLVIMLLAVLATIFSWPAVSDSLKGAAERLLDERLQTDSLFKTAESTTPPLTASKLGSFNADIFSLASVWTPKKTYPDWVDTWQKCKDNNCILEYMKKSGASDEALQFTRKIVPEVLESDGYLESFEEKGRVDLGFVVLPTRANTNGAYVFLNGSPSVVSTEQRGVEQLDISGDSNYSMLKKQYPQLQIWGNGAGFVSEHANTNGEQTFILTYMLVDYCHACYIGWWAHVAFDFSKDGTFIGTKFLKFFQDENFAVAATESATAIPCSTAKTSLRSEFDPSIDPYCHGDFILDNIRVSDAAGGGFDISMNVFIRGEADAALEVNDAAGNLVDSTLMPGHRPIPANLYDLFIQNQINVAVGLTDEYPWNDYRDSRQSQMTRDVRVHVPAGGRFELTKSSDRAITYNMIRWAIEVISEADLDGANITQRRINDIAVTMGTEVADLIRKEAFSEDKPDVSAVLEIVASVATTFLDPDNLDGRLVFQGALKKAIKNVYPQLRVVALEGKSFNTINAYLDLYNAARDTDGAVYWRAPLPGLTKAIDSSNFSGIWEYSVRESPNVCWKEYLKLEKMDSGEFKLLRHIEDIKTEKLDYCDFKLSVGNGDTGKDFWQSDGHLTTTKNADGTFKYHQDNIYLKLSNGKLKGEFSSNMFGATHGLDVDYKITLELISNNKMHYSVLYNGGTLNKEHEATKISD